MRAVRRFLNGAVLVTVPSFGDDRGSFTVTYEREAGAALGMDRPFVQDNQSWSKPTGTLRGLHLQLPPHEQGKLVRVLRGSIFDAIVDLRPGSPSHGAVETVELTAGGDLLWVPPGFGHGFCTLEPDTEVFYKVDAPYRPDAERTLAWDDPVLGIDWPLGADGPTLSAKDAEGWSFATIVAAIEEGSP